MLPVFLVHELTMGYEGERDKSTRRRHDDTMTLESRWARPFGSRQIQSVERAGAAEGGVIRCGLF